MSETSSNNPFSKRYLRHVGLSFFAITAVLVISYFLYTRYDFEALYSGLDIEDASLIAAELDRQGVRYRVEGREGAILVQENKIEEVRLAVYNAGGPTRGLTGFELFNESEMGLTDFAQKIKFQRAIQGELSRTIMMFDGVKRARVHVAIPERSVFRSQRTEPKAAITLIASNEGLFGDDSILGIQRLVASSIPGLSLRYVTVVDGHGRIISRTSEIMEPVDLEQSADLVGERSEQVSSEGIYHVAAVSVTAVGGQSLLDVEPSLKQEVNVDNAALTTISSNDISNSAEIPAAYVMEMAETDFVAKKPISPRVVELNEVKLQQSANVRSDTPKWALLLVLGNFMMLGLIVVLGFRRNRAGLSSDQREAFAIELRQALRSAEEESLHA